MRKMRTAIIGLGMASKPHAESYLALSDRVEVIAAYSPTKSRREKFHKQYGFPVCDDLNSIFNDPSIDYISLLTPPNTHLDLVGKCAEAGKHVLLEKPLEISTARARSLVSTCRDAGVTLGIVLQHRFRPNSIRLKEIFASGRLGPVVGATVRVLNWRPQSYYDEPGRGDKNRDGGGVMLTQAIHTIDLFLSLVGVPEEVMGYAATTPVHHMETEDIAGGVLKYGSGAIATLTATTVAYPGFPEEIVLYCRNGTAVLKGSELHVFYSNNSEDHFTDNETTPTGGAGADPMAFSNNAHQSLIEDFLDALIENRDAVVSGENALDAHRLIDAILLSSNQGKPAQLR